jgi:hypothetical protein
MGFTRKYEDDTAKDYADSGPGQIISRSLFAVVERGDLPLVSGFGDAEIVELETGRVRIDTVPEDTMARSPDDAAKAATAMIGLSNGDKGQVGFRVEYLA